MLLGQFSHGGEDIRREPDRDMLIFCCRIHITIIALPPLYVKQQGPPDRLTPA